MYKRAIAAFALAATGVLLPAGPAVADLVDDDWPGCVMHMIRPVLPLFDTLGFQKIVEEASGGARVCVYPDPRPILERVGFTE
ncbi:hypothetical protein ACIBQX_49605 [Nonomuraea sp. NPDC049714]|uniref:hypothetical protein n=1 Tax=Nonomuraea sp. NPDC049714 TaxID=3364357 RepID=UPI0037A6DC32